MTELSLYEQVADLSTIKKQWFFDLFQGDALDTDRWNEENNTGTCTFAMSDTINGGFSISTNTTAGGHGAITFNLKRPFSNTASVFISRFRSDNLSDYLVHAGFSEVANAVTPSNDWALWRHQFNTANFLISTSDNTTSSSTQSSVARDDQYHTFKATLGASNCIGDLDGVQEITKTTNLPSAKLQPNLAVRNSDSIVHTGYFTYYEAYNT